MKELNLTIPWGEYVRLHESVDRVKLYDSFIKIFCVMENTYLPVAERTLLAYYAAEGSVSSEVEKRYMLESNRNRQAVSNLKYSLLKKGFLIKTEDNNLHELPGFLKQKRDNLTIIIELDARSGPVQEDSQ